MRRFLLTFALMLCASCAAMAATYYWEAPRSLSTSGADAQFPKSVSNASQERAVVLWEEADAQSQAIYISAASTVDGYAWRSNPRVLGPFAYSGETPDLYSAVMAQDGSISLAVVTVDSRIVMYRSTDFGMSFGVAHEFDLDSNLIAPRLYAASDGTLNLFASVSQDESFSLLRATSRNGSEWSDLLVFEPAAGFSNAMVPFLAPVKGGDMVVFQAHHAEGNRNTFQLYQTFLPARGRAWSDAVLVTGEESLRRGDQPGYGNYNNQSPFLLTADGATYLAWERSRYGSTASAIMVAQIDSGGTLSGMEQITTLGNASRPSLFVFGGMLNLLWFDTRSGVSQVYLNHKETVNWDTDDEDLLSVQGRASSFAVPVVSARGSALSFAWQEASGQGTRICALVKDSSCQPPSLRAVNFAQGRTYASATARVQVTLSQDSSGVAGFSYIWTQDAAAEPPAQLEHMPHEASAAVTVRASGDGLWYFKARQCDEAGNWSEPATITYRLDATPPHMPLVTPPAQDGYGFVASSSFTVRWAADAQDDDVAGYTWSMRRLSGIADGLAQNRYHSVAMPQEDALALVRGMLSRYDDEVAASQPPNRLMGSQTQSHYANWQNGVYVFSVAAVDAVGNVGPAAHTLLFVNKYEPATSVTRVRYEQDDEGTVTATVYGTGFAYDGRVVAVYVDRDGEAPYDAVVTAQDGLTVSSDSAMGGIVIAGLEPGTYRVGVEHPVRGTYFAPGSAATTIEVTESGTVKIAGQHTFVPRWKAFARSLKYRVNAMFVVLALVLVLALAGFVAALCALARTAKEAALVWSEVRAIAKGGLMPQEKKARKLGQKTTSLRYKIIGYSAALVVTIVALITAPLAMYMTGQQQQTLFQGLESRVNVLLDSLVTEARTNLPPAPAEDRDKLDNLPDQMNALSAKSEQGATGIQKLVAGIRQFLTRHVPLLSREEPAPEAVYVTITGFDEDMSTVNFDYVWATNDVVINPPLKDAADVSPFVPGGDRLFDAKDGLEKEYVARIISDLQGLNQSVASQVDSLRLMYEDADSSGGKQFRDDVDALLTAASATGGGSYPKYDVSNLDEAVDEYIFFEPVLDSPSAAEEGQNYVRGIALVKVNVQTLRASMRDSSIDIGVITLLVILLAVLIGFLGSLMLAGVIIRPIKTLVSHVAMIRDTEDKEQLAGKDIAVTTRDEIGILGDTVNDMTHGLVQAAIASKNLVVGKEVQTRFLPLQTDGAGNTLTTGSLSVPGADFFSYYAGADELSGDYFDYRQIDNNRYAVIKCDVSGHGVPAALIMVEVATLFLNYFSKWNPRQNVSQSLQNAVGRINDLLEQRGFKGRFAAFTLCIFDTSTGEVCFCNAGDNLVQIYDGTEHKKKTVTLPETPAAGMFSTDLVDMRGGYKVSRVTLKKDDVLFLYTDGIEEAKRNFRDAMDRVVPCAEPGLAAEADHLNHKVGETSEEMTAERVTAIIEAVFRREQYALQKCHAPDAAEQWTFDFSSCQGTAEEAVMALVSVEKVFRLYKKHGGGDTDRVKVDRSVDAFLQRHFVQYRSYASSPQDVDGDPHSVWWTGVSEDPQYDDLTLIAIKKR